MNWTLKLEVTYRFSSAMYPLITLNVTDPYSAPLPWVAHASEYRRTVVLLNQDTSTEWARLARRSANLIILLDWRIKLIHAETGERGPSNNRCQQLFIFGAEPPEREAEVRIFSLSDLEEFCR